MGSVLTTSPDLERAVAACTAAAEYGFDLETTGLDPHSDRITGLALSTAMNRSWWFPFRRRQPDDDIYAFNAVWQALQPVLCDPEKIMVGSGLKFDLKMLAKHGIDVKNKTGDTVLIDWLLNENERAHGIKTVAPRVLGVKMQSFEEATAIDRLPLLAEAIIDEEGGDPFVTYAMDDARFALKVWKRLWPRIVSQELDKAYWAVEEPTMRVVARLELSGIALDEVFLKELKVKFLASQKIADAEARAAADGLDVLSPQVLSRYLFDEEKVPPPEGCERGKNGFYSVSADFLEVIDHPVAQKVLAARKVGKLLSTYVLPYLDLLRTQDRVYCSLNTIGTVTGRMSSKEPNLQQVPSQGEGKMIRKAFIAPPGKKLIVGDFNQLEYRMAGHCAMHYLGKSNIADAYAAGADLHDRTQTSMGFEPGKDGRKKAKVVNFRFIYGGGAKAFHMAEHRPLEQAQKWHYGFHQTYPELRIMQQICSQQICAQGYITTITNRRRRFPRAKGNAPEDHWWDGWVAWNSMVQGSSADLVKLFMRNLQREIDRRAASDPEWAEVLILLQVHDEVITEAPEHLAQEVKELKELLASTVMTLNVDMKMECGAARDWESAKP